MNTNIPDEKLAKVGKLFIKQISYIQKYGCNGIKCKQCCLMNICSREPAKAKMAATAVLNEAFLSIKTDKKSE
jgi:hypothetical protein